jgi:hypothetical protein
MFFRVTEMNPEKIAKLITEDPDILNEDQPCPGEDTFPHVWGNSQE